MWGKLIIAMMWHVGILLLLPVICNAPDGLILHAWTTEPEKAVWADKTTGLSPEVWSEGMGWYTLVVPELLALLPKTHPNYQQVLDIYLKMCKGLKKVQDKNTGGWFMLWIKEITL